VSLNDWGIFKLIKTITMLKNILKLEGAQKLNKNEQKSINGGLKDCIDPTTNACKYISLACASPCRPELQ
jgi:hypothetical protein